MEMLSSFRGDKHELCLVVIKFKHVRSFGYFVVMKFKKCLIGCDSNKYVVFLTLVHFIISF